MEPVHKQQPGIESKMAERPQYEPLAKGSGKLDGKTALITGGDSGIGRAVALAFANEGADVVIAYLNERGDADETRRKVEERGRKCLAIAGDVGEESHCRQIVEQTISQFGKLDIVVNNAAEQHPQKSLEDITAEQLQRTFQTNVFAQFYLLKAALPHLKENSVIINTASVTAYQGSPQLLDYSATKGAIIAFTRSLSQGLAEKKIRVNAVAPGPIWTPLIPSTFPQEKVEKFGQDTPLQRKGQPNEVAPCYVFLASEESRYMTGQVLHPNGGDVVNG